MFVRPFVVVAGSRSLPASAAGLVASVVRSLLGGGRGVAVGCASGADAFALRAALAAGASRLSLRVFAVGGLLGFGFWRSSAPFALLRRAAWAVVWWAGGSCACAACSGGGSGWCPSLRRRLARRSRAAVSFASSSRAAGPGAGFVAFVSSPASRGSFGAARFAASLGLPVVVFPVGFAASRLPLLSAGGRWVPAASSGVWARGFRWVPAGAKTDRPACAKADRAAAAA